jgi:hypothetical protein
MSASEFRYGGYNFVRGDRTKEYFVAQASQLTVASSINLVGTPRSPMVFQQPSSSLLLEDLSSTGELTRE